MSGRLALLFVFAVLAACGRSGSDKAAAQGPTVSLGDFEHSSFYRKHPAVSREQRTGRRVYRFDDRYSESRSIEIAFDVEGERVSGFTLTWSGEPDHPAQWSSVKKQFMADLLESTFWDVDYGQVSSHLMDEGTRTYSAADPAVPLGPVRIRSGGSGSDLIVQLER